MLRRTCLAGRFMFRAFRFSPSDGMKPTPPFPWFSSPSSSAFSFPPSFLRFLFPRPGVYTVNPYIAFFHPISAVLYTWKLHRTSSAPNALHEHSTTVHAVYFFSGFPAQSLISLHRHLFFISISPLSLPFFRQTYSSIFSLFRPQVTPIFLEPFLFF